MQRSMKTLAIGALMTTALAAPAIADTGQSYFFGTATMAFLTDDGNTLLPPTINVDQAQLGTTIWVEDGETVAMDSMNDEVAMTYGPMQDHQGAAGTTGQFETDMSGAVSIASLSEISTDISAANSGIYHQVSAAFGDTTTAKDIVVHFAWAENETPQQMGSFALIVMLDLTPHTWTTNGSSVAV